MALPLSTYPHTSDIPVVNVETLYQSHHRELVQYVTNLTGNPEDADDVAQETYLRLVRRPPADERDLRAWLFRVATNILRDQWKHERHERRLDQMPDRAPMGDPPPTPDVYVERSEARVRLAHILEPLSVKERTALLMREAGFAHREIAEAVGTTTRSVGTLIARALRKVTSRVEGDHA